MNKRQLSRLRKLKKEAEVIKQEIRDLEFKPVEKTTDTANDYSTGYPVVITIEGFGAEDYVKAKNRLYEQLRRKLIAIEKERMNWNDTLTVSMTRNCGRSSDSGT